MADKAKADADPNYSEPAADLSAKNFLSDFLRHVVT
jgi:hypothetical protein